MRQSRLGSGWTGPARSDGSSATTASHSRSSVSRTAAALRSTPKRLRWRIRRRSLLAFAGPGGRERGQALERAEQECPRAGRRIQQRHGLEQPRTADGSRSASRRSASASGHPIRPATQAVERGVEQRPHQRCRGVVGARRSPRVRRHHALEDPAQHVGRDAAGVASSATMKWNRSNRRSNASRQSVVRNVAPDSGARADEARTGRR